MSEKLVYCGMQLKPILNHKNSPGTQLHLAFEHKGIVKSASFLGEDILRHIDNVMQCQGIESRSEVTVTIEITVGRPKEAAA